MVLIVKFQADGGGVGSCRRDLVDRLNSVYWTQLSEIGNPMKLTIYQTDRNVRNLYLIFFSFLLFHLFVLSTIIFDVLRYLIPLWGEFMGEPCEYILTDVAYAKISIKKWATTRSAINQYASSLFSSLRLSSPLFVSLLYSSY